MTRRKVNPLLESIRQSIAESDAKLVRLRWDVRAEEAKRDGLSLALHLAESSPAPRARRTSGSKSDGESAKFADWGTRPDALTGDPKPTGEEGAS